jgi:nucleoside-diphosphate-sugar epimerase
MNALHNVAVLGAGYVGSAVARALAAEGTAVWAVRRRSAASDAGVTWLTGDLASGQVAGLPADLDAVILSVAPSSGADRYEATYPPAARTAVTVAAATQARALVYTSSTGVYGEHDGGWVTESTPRHGAGPGNQALIEAEDALLQSGRTGVTVLRVAGIYGPGRDPRGRYAHPGMLPRRGQYWTNLAHQTDIVGAILHTLSHDGAPRALNVCDGNPALAADVARWCAAERGQDPAALVFDNDAPLGRSNQRVSNAALRATGWEPQFPSFREGFTHGV